MKNVGNTVEEVEANVKTMLYDDEVSVQNNIFCLQTTDKWQPM